MSVASGLPVLSGCSVLVTRPLGSGETLCAMIRNAGGRATHLPCIEIEAVPSSPDLERTTHPASPYDWLIFISRNAVTFLNTHKHWPIGKIAAIGASTAHALAEIDHPPDLVPPHGSHTSEDLLNCNEMKHVNGLRILIVRGEGGRPTLGTELERRGAKVSHAALYRRKRPSLGIEPQFSDWLAEGQPILTISSGEGLQNLLALCSTGQRARLAATAVIVPSQRIAHETIEMNLFATVVTAANATNDETMRALGQHVQQHSEFPGCPPRDND